MFKNLQANIWFFYVYTDYTLLLESAKCEENVNKFNFLL